MDIRPLKVTVREIVAGHVDGSDREEGIRGYSGRLDIRPKYQRNYIYDNAKRNAVIDTVSKDFPLGLMYWVRNEEGNYEILDGQQATGLVKFRNCAWFTNLDTTKRHEEMVFTRTLAEGNYPKYDNFDAIDVASLDGKPRCPYSRIIIRRKMK